jgi:hypothetical protein
LINEVEYDPPSSDSPGCQYVEIRGMAGSTVPTGTQFLSVDGETGAPGTVDLAVDLSGLTVGPNGTITLAISPDFATCDRTFPDGTTVVRYFNFNGIGVPGSSSGAGDAQNFLLVNSSVLYSDGSDADTNNDEVLNPDITLIDGFAFTVNNAIQFAYAPLIYDAATQSTGQDLPDAVTRFSTNTTPLNAAAFYYGNLQGAENSITYLQISGGPAIPSGGQLTPGAPNSP